MGIKGKKINKDMGHENKNAGPPFLEEKFHSMIMCPPNTLEIFSW